MDIVVDCGRFDLSLIGMSLKDNGDAGGFYIVHGDDQNNRWHRFAIYTKMAGNRVTRTGWI